MPMRPQNSPKGLFVKNVIGLKALTAVPTTRYGPGSIVFVYNSTGKTLAVNTTGTTWKYFSQTSVLA